MGIIFAERGKASAPKSKYAMPSGDGSTGGGSNRFAATNMGPRGFTDAQKAQINARLKKKMATVIKST